MRKNNKRAFLISMLSIVLCLSMLIGTTFAWFTDTDTTAVNDIVSGTLDIEVVDGAGNPKTSLTFAGMDGSNILWEPGATFRTETFKVKNNGNLYLKYKILVNNTEVSYNKLNEVITFTMVDQMGDAVDLENFEGELAPAGTPYEAGTLPPDASFEMYIIAKMDENAGNEYQGLTLEGLSFTVMATQDTVEVDKDNNLYDEDAEYVEGAKVTSVPKNDDMKQTDLQTALNKGEGGIINFGGSTIKPDPNNTWEAAKPHAAYYTKLPSNNSTIANLNFAGSVYGLEIHGDITFDNCTFIGTYAPNISDGKFEPGKVTFKNCTIQGFIALASNCVTSVEYINCEFLDGTFMNSYQDATFINCTFDSTFGIDDELAGEQTVTFSGCTGLSSIRLNPTGTYKTITFIQN